MSRTVARQEVASPKLQRRKSLAYVPYLFLLPALLLLIAFRYIPAFSAVYHSFTIWDGVTASTFVGLQQYQTLFADPIFIRSLQNILLYTFARAFISIAMSLFGAELVYNLRNARVQAIWRVVFTLPMVIPITVGLLIWQQIYAGRTGLINQFLQAVGLGQLVQPWLGQPDTALWALVLIGFPLVSGLSFLVLLAALQNLPSEISDAALIDGCTPLRRVFSIDIPSIRGPLALVAILQINAGLQEFAPMLVITRGGPLNSTQSPGHYLFQQAFSYGSFGYATAIGTTLMAMMLLFSLIILRIRYRKAHDVEV